jgi:hypothetical protein
MNQEMHFQSRNPVRINLNDAVILLIDMMDANLLLWFEFDYYILGNQKPCCVRFTEIMEKNSNLNDFVIKANGYHRTTFLLFFLLKDGNKQYYEVITPGVFLANLQEINFN